MTNEKRPAEADRKEVIVWQNQILTKHWQKSL